MGTILKGKNRYDITDTGLTDRSGEITESRETAPDIQDWTGYNISSDHCSLDDGMRFVREVQQEG